MPLAVFAFCGAVVHFSYRLEEALPIISAVLMGVFYLIATELDMMLALIVTMFALCLVWGERHWWTAALVAMGTTAFVFFTFDLVLEVRFPRGILTDPYYG